MADTFNSKYFGQIHLEQHLDAFVCEAQLEMDNCQIDIDLWFDENDQAKKKHFKKVDQFLDSVDERLQHIKMALQSDCNQKKEVHAYLQHHLEILDKKELFDLGIDTHDNGTAQIDQLFAKLSLIRIGLYPTNSIASEFATFDFTIGKQITNYLIVPKVKRKGKILSIEMES